MGDQSKDGANQAMAFLPNELWIHPGDSITWTSKSTENHTVTFLKQFAATSGANAAGASPSGTTRPSGAVGCGGNGQGGTTYTAGGVGTLTVDGTGVTNCLNSGPICDDTLLASGEPFKCTGWTTTSPVNTGTPEKTFKVTFANTGNFKLVCLIHADQTGTVHVLDSSTGLPHQQWFYDDEARDQARSLISDADHARKDLDDNGDSSRHVVITPGELVAYGGGKSYLAVMRYVPSTIYVNVGDSVEWVDTTPSEPHTITFGEEPASSGTLLGVLADADVDGDREGALPNVLNSAEGPLLERPNCTAGNPCLDTFNSGIIGPAQQEIGGTAQKALSVTRASVKFTAAGTYEYFCILHDELGMRGRVIVGSGHHDNDSHGHK